MGDIPQADDQVYGQLEMGDGLGDQLSNCGGEGGGRGGDVKLYTFCAPGHSFKQT
jgi:hypothetical protein